MNDRHNDPLDQSIRSALGDIVSESPAPGDLPVRSLELRRAEASTRPRRLLLVAAATLVLAGVAGTVAIANRSSDQPTTTLDPAEASEELAEAQARLDRSASDSVDNTLPGTGTDPEATTTTAASRDGEGSPGLVTPPPDSSVPGPAVYPPPNDTTPITVILSNYTVFDVSVPRQVQAGEPLLIEWSVENSDGIDQTNFRVGGASGWVSWCPFPVFGSRISGNERLGRYRAGCTVPETTPNGTYTVFFQASSPVGAPSEPLGTSQVDFEVVNGSSDNSPPTISQVRMPATAVVGDSITITWRAVDPSGVNYSIAWLANGGFALPDGTRVVDYGDFAVTRISGDEFDGVYSQTVRFTERSPLGTYTIWFSRRDDVGNRSIDEVSGTIVLGA